VPIVGASYSGIFSILDENYITNISELPTNENFHFNTTIQHNQGFNIGAWITIVGFKNMVKEDGIFYIHEDPAQAAIVRYGYGIFDRNELKSIEWASSRQKKYYSIEPLLTTYIDNQKITSKLRVILKWQYYCSDEKGNFPCGRGSETQYFYTSALAPQQYPNLNNTVLIGVEYNNSFNPRTIVSENNSNAMEIIYEYKGQKITHLLKKAHVDQTTSGVYFANISGENVWTPNQVLIQQNRNEIHLINTSSPNWKDFEVVESSIYETRENNISIIERQTYNIEDPFPPFLVNSAIFFSCILVLGTYLIKRR
jgi:hypothetical protein